MYDEYGRWHDVYWHHFGGFFDIIILLLIIGGIVYLIQNLTKLPTDGTKKEDSALDTLKKRYASGDISLEEFEQKKKNLKS